jgi:shikimate kinase
MNPAAPTGKLPKPPRTVVLVGLMGAGKSCIGRKLAADLALEFVDADSEIEEAAGCSVADIFKVYGEDAFRDVERRVIARLLDGPVRVVATGGGAFMDPETRARVKEKAVSVWLRADIDLLANRVARRGDRPLLKGKDSRKVLTELMETRGPYYAEADITVDSGRESPDATTVKVLAALSKHFASSDRTGADATAS